MTEGGTHPPPVVVESDIVAEPVPANKDDGARLVAEESAFLDKELKNADLIGRKQDIAERKSYASKLFWLIAIWLGLVLATVWACALQITPPSWWPEWVPSIKAISLSDAVLLALIGTTTANVLGLFVIVARYLFPDGKPK